MPLAVDRVHAAPQSNVVPVEGFEDGLVDKVRFVQKRSFAGSMSLESDPKYVRNGNHSVKVDYDFIGIKDNPSYVYVGPVPAAIPVQGYPKKVGMWLYGNNDGHVITSKFRDGSGKSFEVEYLDEKVGVNWTGWKYIETELPQDKPLPLVMEIYMQIEQTDFEKKNKGAVWVDDVRWIYGETNEDTSVPELTALSPAPDQSVNSDRPDIVLSVKDNDAIDPASIKLTLDGQPIQPVFDAAAGTIAYRPSARLAGGYHQVEASLKDRSGNPAAASWTFNVATGAQFRIKAPSTVISNDTFQFELQVNDVRQLTGTYTKLQFDPGTLEVIDAQSVLPSGQIKTNRFDNAAGTYELETERLEAANLNADATLATVQFKVKRSARMERGETAKYVKLAQGELRYAGGDLLPAFAAPHPYKVESPYHIAIAGASLNTESTIRVTDQQGAPVADAAVEFVDSAGPQSFVKVTSSSSAIYTAADNTSVKKRDAMQNERFFAVGGSDPSYINVYMPDGKSKGWIPAADVELQPLNASIPVTDAKGEVATPLITLAQIQVQLQAVKDGKISQTAVVPVVSQLGGDSPEYVHSFVTEQPKTMRSITWRTAPRVKQTFIQYVKESEFAGFRQANVKEQAAASSFLVAPDNSGELRYHQALLKNLQPGTSYRYRVGYDGHWSPEATFRTEPEADKPFSFLFVTDSHTNSEEGRDIYRSLLANALTVYPDTAFVAHGGDVVDDGGEMEEWERFWEASSPYSASLPSAYVIGNHDNKNGGKTVFKSALGLPDNGMPGDERLTYSFDYGDAHIVALNSESNDADMVKQAEWLRKDLAASNKKWKMAMFHRTPYHTEGGRGPESVTRYLAPVLEELGVDFVLVGHDHVLANTYPMMNGKPQSKGKKGTVYLVGGASGWKFYDGYPYDYLEHYYDDDVPVYSSIQVQSERILIESRTESGVLVHSFSVEKPLPQLVSVDFAGKTALTVGERDQSVAQAVYENGVKLPLGSGSGVIYTSDNKQIADINESGLVTAVGLGQTVVRATYGGKEGSYSVTVTAKEKPLPQLVALLLDGKAELTVGEQAQSVAQAVYSDGMKYPLRSGVVYASKDKQVATVSDNGLITATGKGQTVISATYRGLEASYSVKVTGTDKPDAVLTGIVFSGKTEMRVGEKHASVVQAVYSDGTKQPVLSGVTYTSDNGQIVQIAPSGLVAAVGPGQTTVRAAYNGFEGRYSITVAGGSTGSRGRGSSSPATVPVAETNKNGLAVRTLTAEELKKAPAGDLVYTLDAKGEEIIVPANAAELLKGRRLVFKAGAYQFTVNGDSLAGISGGGSYKAIALTIAVDNDEASAGKLAKAQKAAAAGVSLKTASASFQLALEAVATDDKRTPQSVGDSILAALELPSGANRKLAGLYRMAEDGTIEYVRAPLKGSVLTAGLEPNRPYLLLDYRKSYADVSSSHWAAGYIEHLSAMHIANGVDANRFNPDRSITRAEFVALLARKTNLKASAASGFQDVAKSDWFADAVYAAKEAKLIDGRTANAFEPNAAITRQEMAAIMVRAYEALHGTVSADNSTAFKDMKDAPAWSQQAVSKAYKLRLIDGYESNEFKPQGEATRAETAKLLSVLEL